jgi:hypothetical protein
MDNSDDDILPGEARRLINTAVELMFGALDRKHPGTDPDVVHMPRHLVETIAHLLCEARDNYAVAGEA